MNPLGGGHELKAKAVVVQSYALDLLAIRGHDRHSLIPLGKFFGRFRESPGEPLAGLSNGLYQGFHRSRGSHRRQVGPNATSLAFHHVTRRTIGVTIEDLFSMHSIAEVF